MKIGVLSFFLVTLVISPARGLYEPAGPVTMLSPSNFKTQVGNGVWMVEFYAPWCGHCQNLKSEWVKLAMALKGVVNVGAVDADAHGALGQQYGVKGFPTIKLMYADSSGNIKSVDYTGGRTANEMAKWAMSQAQKIVLARLGGGSSSSSSGFYGGTNVVELSDANFHKRVSDSDDMWFVEFYAPWCGHCKALKPAWTGLATSLKGKVKVGAVDCTANQQTCSEFGVQGFPTLKFFGDNKESPMDYNGGRDEADLVNFATEQWSKAQPPPEVRELTDHEVWTEHCVGSDDSKPKQLCLIAFLPHILDSKAKGRNGYIDMLKEIALMYKERPFAWFWVQGGSQQDLESKLGVGGFGYPAFVALNSAKGKYATLRSGFESTHVKEFMDNVRRGQEPVVSVDGAIGTLSTIDAWDGKDGEEPIEEEFSLEDLGIGSSEEL